MVTGILTEPEVEVTTVEREGVYVCNVVVGGTVVSGARVDTGIAAELVVMVEVFVVSVDCETVAVPVASKTACYNLVELI